MTIGKIYFVTVSLDYNTSPMNQPKLLGTTEDSASMVKLMRGYTDSIYVLTNAQATESNLRAVLAEATQDPNGFLVFHYSGHGIKSNVTGKEGICLYDKIMYDTDFWEAIKNGSCRKVMTIFAACYSGGIIPAEGGLRLMSAAEDRPRGGFFQEAAKSVFAPRRSSRLMAASAPSDTGFSVLCWSPCSADELSYMIPARAEHPGLQYCVYQSADDADKDNRIKYGTVYGHEFIGRICEVFDPKLTYEQLWNKIGAEYCTYGYKSRTTSKIYQYENWQDMLVHRQKTVIGASFENEQVFSLAGSSQSDDIKYETYQTGGQAEAWTDTDKTYGLLDAYLADKASKKVHYDKISSSPTGTCGCMLGWEYESGSNVNEFRTLEGSAGEKGSFKEFRAKAMLNKRPMLIVYTEAGNKGSNSFNKAISGYQKTFPAAIYKFQTCQTGAFDDSLKQYGFYILYYQNKPGGGIAEADEVKEFVTQFGNIATGYPWYMVYQYRDGGKAFARYGSLKTTSDTSWYPNVGQASFEKEIYVSFSVDVIQRYGAEIGYLADSQPAAKQYTVEFRNYDNSVIEVVTVDEGSIPSAPSAPSRPGYDFTGWSPPLAAVQSDAVYVAQYAKSQATADPAPISNPVVLKSEITIRSGAAVREVSDAYWKNPPSPAPKIYGYVTPTDGPGDSCFQDVLDGAKRGGWPVVMVLDCGAKAGSDFAADCNDGTDFEGDRYLLQWINLTVRQELKAGLCYFRGNNQSPKAYDDARKFATQNGIDVSTGLTQVGFIYDGEKFIVRGEALPASVVRYKALTEAMIKALDVKRSSSSALKPRRLAPRKDIFDANNIYFDYRKGIYNAGDTSRNLTVEIGVWNGNLEKTMEVADAENVPVLVMFGTGNCGGHYSQLQSVPFQNWQLSCNMYLSYCNSDWHHGGYSEHWLTSQTIQSYPVKVDGVYKYHRFCPEYGVHWKRPDGSELNIGKYLSRNGDSTGFYYEPYVIEGFLSGYFSQYQSIDYNAVIVNDDSQRDFSIIGRGTTLRIDNLLANKINYRVSVPYKNLENIKAFSEKFDVPLIAIYYNSAGSDAGNSTTLKNAFNVGAGFDEWIKLDDTAIVWADVADTDGGKAAAGGEHHKWIADLDAHPERADDKWAFRFYSKQHGVDKSYSFKEIYDKVYDSDQAKATENLENFIRAAFAPYYNNETVSIQEETELFTVEYLDYDGQQLIPQQTVLQGHDAQSPADPPVRSGYTFIGYMPTGQNVNSDLTCVAQYKATGGASGYFLQHTYDPGSYALRISNNLCAIQVIGDMRGNGMATQLTSVQFQDNLFEIMPSCFMNCAQLRTVDIKNKTRWIGDYAFYGCSRLESVNALTYPKQTQVNTIGAHSFQNTGLTDVAIDLTASQYSAGIGEYAFAGCKALRSARIVHSSYVGRSAFENCAALTSVTLPDSGCYSYPEAFAGCAALPSISIPHNVQSLNDGLFKDCAALTSVTIRDSAQAPSELDYVGPDIFNGCRNLTSITLPPSITSIMQLDQNFLRGSAIREITFNGLSDDVFQSGYVESRTTKIQGYITNEQQFYTAAKDALARNIPIVMITMENSPQVDLNSPDCPRCRALAAQLLSQDWQSYMNSNRNKCYFVLAQLSQNQQLFNVVSNPSYSSVPLFQGAYSFGSSWTLYSKVVVYYRDIGGKVQVSRMGWPSVEDDKTAADPGKLRNFVDTIVSKANNPVQDESRLSAMISKLGSPLDYIVAYSKTGREYRLSSNSSVDAYTPPVVDTDTVSGFKTGVWYYNAKELKQYADENSLPVFVEYSDRWCPSCIKFRNEIYGRSEFQEWVAKQPYLFCRIETEYYDEFNRMFTQPYFVRNTWAKNASITLPGMVFYWNREQNPVWDVVGYGDDPIGYVELQDMISRKFQT